MDLSDVCTALSNETRRKLVEVINSEGPLTNREAHEIFEREYRSLRRESIYKALEKLVSSDILVKEYINDRGVVYKLDTDKVLLDLREMEAVPMEN
jgi:Fe2+ or Zn2+ uptake regulation protein